MLFILRQLRRSFFQPGKLRTYVAYAIGEILLIVIGILIAVQIGEWQQDREERQWELKALGELREELLLNVQDFEFAIKEAKEFAAAAEYFIEAIEKQLPYDPEVMPSKFWYALQTPWFRTNDTAYRTIETKGLHAIQNDELRKAMIYLYTRDYNEFMLLREEDIGRRNYVGAFFSENFRVFNFKNHLEPTNYDALIKDPVFSSLLTGHKSGNEGLASGWIDTSIKRTKDLIALIDAELANP